VATGVVRQEETVDERILAEVEGLLRLRKDDAELVAALSESFGGTGREQSSVRAIRDGFTKTLRTVRSGRAQLVGTKPEDQVVIISLKDLARMVRRVAHDVSFGEALRATPHFHPVPLRAEMRQRLRGGQVYVLQDGHPAAGAEG
jgi:hypothetical protein